MVNIAFVVVVLSKIIRITYGLDNLSSGLGGIGAAVNDLTGNLLPVASSLTNVLGVQSLTIPIVGNIGTVALPVKTLCIAPIVKDVFCTICYLDCKYVHNTYGGTCSRNPNKMGEEACICAKSAYEAKARNIYSSSEDTCPSLLTSLIPELQDVITLTVLLNRMELLLCPKYVGGGYQNSGCDTDCRENHGALGGYCAVTTPRDSRSGTTATLHCECQFDATKV